MTEQRQKWTTPWWLVQEAELLVGRNVRLDACAEAASAKALRWYGPGSELGEDGLSGEWDTSLTWCNPPYADIGPWVAKALAHTGRNPEAKVLLLVPPRTDQEWWHYLMESGARMMSIRPRVCFEEPDGVKASSPSFPVVLWEIGGKQKCLPLTLSWK